MFTKDRDRQIEEALDLPARSLLAPVCSTRLWQAGASAKASRFGEGRAPPLKKNRAVKIKINGTWVEARVSMRQALLDFIREDLNLTGAKKGCGAGDCSSCVMLIDGHARTTCNLPAYKVDGREIITIEGLAQGGRLHPIQEAFIEAGAIQCGYCTPGMVLQAKDLLDHRPHPTDEEIKEAISSHICRCTGYIKIVEAVRMASERMSETEKG